MLKESDESSGKLASMSKTMSTKNTGKKYRLHQIASLGVGSVIGCEDVLVAKSETHITSLICLSMTGELYRIEKDFFFSKLGNASSFMKRLEKQCTDNVRDQVRKISFAKQNEEKDLAASGQTSTLDQATGPRKPDDPIP